VKFAEVNYHHEKESKMGSRVNGIFVLLTLMLFALTWSGCSKKPQPSGKDVSKAQGQYSSKGVTQSQYSSKDAGKAQLPLSDEEIIKTIDDSGVMKRADGKFTVVPPVKVVEKGKRNKNGSWPVKVKFTLTFKMKDGRISPPTETTTLFSIFEAKDNVGKSVWRAQLGS
jgi:hypothetical protein